MIVLVPIDDDGEDGAPIRFNQPYIHVGHGPHNDLILDEEDQTTSYEHALITVIQGRAIVVCDPTAKPTYIDGADIGAAPDEERQLKPGDIISFGKGKSIFRVEQVGETEGDPEPARRQVRVRMHTSNRKQGVGRPVLGPGTGQGARDGRHDRAVGSISFQVYQGDEMVREEVFDQPLIRIGRMRSSHLLLDDESVSRTHAVIEVTGEHEVLLMDLDSSSGTAVNGTRVKKAILKSGDQLEFGKARVLVSYGEAVAGALATTPAQVVPERREGRRASAPPPPLPTSSDDGLAAPNLTQVLSQDELQPYDGPRLVLRRDGEDLDEFVLTKPQTTIGRLRENDIQLDDGAVSGKHALLVAEKGLFLVVDQNSTNGTYLNGEKCAGDKLQDGDIIQIGRYELVFHAPRPVLALRPPGTEILSPEAARAMFAKVGGRRGRNR
jgi:pSer/pThr/pTyr-binding forkhead associated (FHA) protein